VASQIDKINWLYTLGLTGWEWLEENVNLVINTTLEETHNIVSKSQKTDLDISSLDYFQWLNGVLVPKESWNPDINEYRKTLYLYLEWIYWEFWIKSFYTILNTSNDLSRYKLFLSKIKDKKILEFIYVLSTIDLMLVWKYNLSAMIYDELEINWMSYEAKMNIWLLMYEYRAYEKAHKLFADLIWTPVLDDNKSLLAMFILLNKVIYHDKWNIGLINLYAKVVIESFGKWETSKDEFDWELQFVYQNYLDYYIRVEKDYNKLIEYAYISIDLGVKTSYFHVIHAYLELWEYESASEAYCEWKQLDRDITYFDDIDNIEELYFTWGDMGIVGSIECIIWFYRYMFEIEWYNEEYFLNMIELISWWGYDYNEKDKIFFDLFDKEYEKQEESDNFLHYLADLFNKYAYNDFWWFVDKILLIIAKASRNRYEENMEVKKVIRMWLEKITLIEEIGLNKIDENDKWLLAIKNLEYENRLNELENKNLDDELLNARYEELVLKFSLDILNIADTYSDELQIISSLASIFEYYWLYAPMNDALSLDKYIKEHLKN